MTARFGASLLLNCVASFAMALAIALVALRVSRSRGSRLELLFLGLPFAKVLLDLGRGVPEDSVLRAGVDGPWAAALRLGVDLDFLGPSLRLTLDAAGPAGRYAATLGDAAVAFLERRAPAGLVPALVAAATAMALLRLGRRAAAWLGFRREVEAALRGRPSRSYRTAAGRRVAVHVIAGAGSPYATGLLRPRICLPEASHASLSEQERVAVIEHELAHVAQGHLWLLAATAILRDALWFVPGVGWLHARIAAACEHLADTSAVRRGADPLALASAIVRLHEAGPSQRSASVAASRGATRARVLHLLAVADGRAQPCAPWPLRLAILGWTALALASSTLLGNP